MRNLLYILLFLGLSLNAQEIIRPAASYYSADSIRNRTDLSRAMMDAVKEWFEKGFPEMELPLYQPTLMMRFPKVNRDTVFLGTKLVEYYKDTLIKADVIMDDFSDYGGWIKIRNTFHKYGDKEYIVDGRMYGDQPARYVTDTISSYSEDSTEVTRKYFFTKAWYFSKRESNSKDSLKLLPFTDFCCNAGKTSINNLPVRRHTQSFTKRYFQVRAKDSLYGVIDTLRIQGNMYYKD